jgi:hypothetical protein
MSGFGSLGEGMESIVEKGGIFRCRSLLREDQRKRQASRNWSYHMWDMHSCLSLDEALSSVKKIEKVEGDLLEKSGRHIRANSHHI